MTIVFGFNFIYERHTRITYISRLLKMVCSDLSFSGNKCKYRETKCKLPLNYNRQTAHRIPKELSYYTM